AEVDSASDNRLQRLAAARGVDHFEFDAILLEDAGLGAEVSDGGVPIAALADGELEEIVGAGAGRGGEGGACGCDGEGQGEASLHGCPPGIRRYLMKFS